jgi:hypothetical protein
MINKGQTAESTPFDPTGSMDLTSTDVDGAIKELELKIGDTSKGFVFCLYNGNAGSGRYLEFFNGIGSDTAPIYSTENLEVVEIVSRSTASSTCTIGFYDSSASLPGTLLYTVTFTAQTLVINTGTPLFTLPATGQLTVRVASGSITKPHIYFIARGT